MAIGDHLQCGSALTENTEHSLASLEDFTGSFAQGQKLSLVECAEGRQSKFEGPGFGFVMPYR